MSNATDRAMAGFHQRFARAARQIAAEEGTSSKERAKLLSDAESADRLAYACLERADGVEQLVHCEGCDEEQPGVRRYQIAHHDGSYSWVRYCRGCAFLAASDWNGETRAIRGGTLDRDDFAPGCDSFDRANDR